MGVFVYYNIWNIVNEGNVSLRYGNNNLLTLSPNILLNFSSSDN